MALQRPKSTKELRYFSRKTLGGKGKVMIWIFNPICPKCEERGLKVPYDEDSGRFKSRGKFFVCIYCGHEEPKSNVKSKLPTANIDYTCPHCGHKGGKQEEFKRNAKKEFRFVCDGCGQKIIVGKK